jgi:putative colanic acid biosynthesis UDP-glucose lipid carrier transferase
MATVSPTAKNENTSTRLAQRASVGVRSGPFWSRVQRLLALLALLVLSPVFAALWAILKATSKGPFLYTQLRTGYLGQLFVIYKIRTMAVGSEQTTALGARANEPTLTRTGEVLRHLKLDELPQLWNVVRGDMELVGPRPLPLPLEEKIRSFLPTFRLRHVVPPGLVNPAQLVRCDVVPEHQLAAEWRDRFQKERHCIESKSFRSDCRVLARTILFLLTRLLTLHRCVKSKALPINQEGETRKSTPAGQSSRELVNGLR